MVSLRYPPHSLSLSLSLFLSIYKEPRPRGYRLTVCGSSRPPPIKASSQSILHAMPRAEWPSHRPSALISESHILFSRRRVVGGGFRATTAVSAALAPPPPPCSTSSVFLVSNIFRPRQKFSSVCFSKLAVSAPSIRFAPPLPPWPPLSCFLSVVSVPKSFRTVRTSLPPVLVRVWHDSMPAIFTTRASSYWNEMATLFSPTAIIIIYPENWWKQKR